MPNKRAKTKIYLGGFVEREFKQKIFELAREAGMERNLFGFAQRLIQGPLNQRKVARTAAAMRATAQALPTATPKGMIRAGTLPPRTTIPAAQQAGLSAPPP